MFNLRRYTVVNIYAPNIGASQYIRQMLTAIKGEINSNTIIVGKINTPLTSNGQIIRQKIRKETQALNDTLDKMYLTDVFRNSTQVHKEQTFSRIDPILCHKSSLSKFKKTEIVSSIFSDHNTMKLDVNYRKKKL